MRGLQDVFSALNDRDPVSSSMDKLNELLKDNKTPRI
jgi:hypothetical protein